MKGSKWKIVVLMLVTLLLFNGCAQSTPPPANGEGEAPTTQEDRIALLEAELTSLKQKEQEHLAQIAMLQARVTQLTATNSSSNQLTENVTFHYKEKNGGAMITGYTGNAAMLTIPATLDGLPVTAIGEHAFERASLTAVTLPEGITEIGWFAFYECHALLGVTLPASVSSIGYAVFDGCPSLTLHCPANSYAQQYAQSYAIPYVTP